MDALLVQKKSNTPFFRDIENFFHEVTHIGLEPHQFFLFEISQQIWSLEASKVSTEMSCAEQAVGKFFFVKFAKRFDEQMLKISRDILILI